MKKFQSQSLFSPKLHVSVDILSEALYFLICVFHFKIFLGNPMAFGGLIFSHLHIFFKIIENTASKPHGIP